MASKFTANSRISEAELFIKFRDGDDAAFLELFERYDRRLRLYCLKVVGDMEATEDLVQELWERVIRMRNGTIEIAEPARYLMRMARNLCLKYLQRRRTMRGLDDLNESEHPIAQIHEPSHMEELVKLAVSQLPFDQREVLVLHHYIGHSYEDIAELRGESIGSVKMRAMRARARIARMISAFLGLGKEEEGRPDSEAAANIIRESRK